MNTRYIKPTWFDNHLMVPTIRGLTRLGLSVWGSRVLRVRGRSSGEWRETPVNLLTLDGQRYLVAPRGQTHWVRNIRASREGELKLGSKAEHIHVTEIPDEQKVPILRAYLKRWKFEVGQFFASVDGASPDADVQRIAPDHPVFRIE